MPVINLGKTAVRVENYQGVKMRIDSPAKIFFGTGIIFFIIGAIKWSIVPVYIGLAEILISIFLSFCIAGVTLSVLRQGNWSIVGNLNYIQAMKAKKILKNDLT